VLKIAAVLGKRVPYGAMRHVYTVEMLGEGPGHQTQQTNAQTEATLADAFDVLRESGILTPAPTVNNADQVTGTREFQSVMHMEVVYNAMTFEQRQNLHRTVARYYESHYTHDTNDKRRYLMPMIYHFHKAGEDAAAEAYSAQLQERNRFNASAKLTRAVTIMEKDDGQGRGSLKRSLSKWVPNASAEQDEPSSDEEGDTPAQPPPQKRGRFHS
jgi:predicted ATPase